jgi:hypothetical protein
MECTSYNECEFGYLTKNYVIAKAIVILTNLVVKPKGYICEEDENTIRRAIGELSYHRTIGTVTDLPMLDPYVCNLDENKVYVIKAKKNQRMEIDSQDD